jgi:hypothetical protein
MATSKAIVPTTSNKIKGNNTKNQAMPECPLVHKKFKNHVQKRTKMVFTIILRGWNLVKMPITIEMAAMTK